MERPAARAPARGSGGGNPACEAESLYRPAPAALDGELETPGNFGSRFAARHHRLLAQADAASSARGLGRARHEILSLARPVLSVEGEQRTLKFVGNNALFGA